MRRRTFLFIMPIMIAAWFFIFAILASPARAADIIWDNTLVRIISSFEVNPWDRLIIRPGTIIKLKPGGSIISYGNIEAIGNADHPIIFTSFKDDSAGGDTNGDGAATTPAMGDWGYFLIRGNGSKVTLDYAEIHYAGGSDSGLGRTGQYMRPTSFISVSSYGEPFTKLKEINITHSSITNNFGGVSFYGDAIFNVSESNFYNEANCPLPSSPNWTWNPAFLRCDQLSISKGGGIKMEMPLVYWGHKDGPTTLDDYLKGIKKGTRVFYNANFIPFLIEPWPSDLTGPLAAEPEPVILIPGILGSWNISGRWQLDPIFHTYDNLMEALRAAGYKENSLGEDKPTLFTFPYDWREDNNLTADLLKAKIQQVKEITGRDKVDLVAHSMGGLVARSYIQGAGYQNDIDQVIFLGTPHKGAVESYLKYGGSEFVGPWAFLQKYLFKIEAALNGYSELTDYIRVKVPTVEQLLPIYDYLKDKQPDNSYALRPYPLSYPQNNFLENLNGQEAVELLKQRVKITNIVSDLGLDSTLKYIKVVTDPDTTDNKWQSGYPENLDQNLDSLEKGNGDSTVPLSSADSLSGVETIETNISDHENLPTIMQKDVIKTLTGQEPTDYFNNKLISTFKRWAFFRVYSPVDFAVVAPDGKRIGKDFTSNTEINEIPDAFYSGFNDHAEFVLIPNPIDGEYKIELQGVDSGGEYTLANSIIDADKETGREFTGVITPAQQREFTINYSAASENPISELEPIDTVPPVIAINQPVADGEYLHSSNLIIDYTATDDFSGLASTTITLDGQALATTTIDLFYYLNGEHELAITAIDKAGNSSSATVKFEIITSLDSILSDLDRLYQLGWITDRTTAKLIGSEIKEIKWHFKLLDEAKKLIDRYIKKVGTSNNNAKTKAKLVQRYNEDLERLDKENDKKLTVIFDRLIKSLGKYLKKALINQAGYDIIMSDINYLRENL